MQERRGMLGSASMFDWNDLRYFLELARQGRLAPAARRLQVDQSTVGRRIAELEKSLNTQLFHRAPSGYVLTEAGHRLLGYAESIEVNTIAIAENAGHSAAPTGTVRLATMEGLASFYVAPRLVEFHKSHPGILVELIISTQLLNLTKREADVSLSFVRPTGPRLIVRRIGQVDLRLYGAPAYLEQHGTPRSLEDLRTHRFVAYIDDLVQIREVLWLYDAIEEPNVVFRSTSMISQHNAAAAGLGLVMSPSFIAAGDSRLRPLRIEGLSVKRELWLSTHEDFRYMARVKAVMEFLRERVERDQALLDGTAP
jgi:DNA-binding transcriptional LysR family regulator